MKVNVLCPADDCGNLLQTFEVDGDIVRIPKPRRGDPAWLRGDAGAEAELEFPFVELETRDLFCPRHGRKAVTASDVRLALHKPLGRQSAKQITVMARDQTETEPPATTFGAWVPKRHEQGNSLTTLR